LRSEHNAKLVLGTGMARATIYPSFGRSRFSAESTSSELALPS